MLENLSGVVGYAMHDDLLMRRKQDARVAEAERGWKRQRQGAQRTPYREAVAKALIALANLLTSTKQDTQTV